MKAPNGAPVTILPGTLTKSGFGGASKTDASGNIYQAGLADGVTTEVTKFDGQFNQLWKKTVANFRTETNADFAVDAAGNVYVGGASPAFGTGKASIAKFAPDGTAGPITTIGSSGEIDLLATGSDNTVYAVGTGAQLPNQPPGGGGFALHYGTDGTLLQAIQESLITGNVGRSLQVDATGSITFVGNNTITKLGPTFATVWDIPGPLVMSVTPDGSGVYDWNNNVNSLEKRDPTTGSVIWSRPFATQMATLNAVEGQTWTGRLDGEPTIMLATTDSLYLAGSYGNQYANGSSPIPSDSPGFVARLDLTGQQIWFRQFKATLFTQVQNFHADALAVAPQGQLLVVGNSDGFYLKIADGTGP